MSDLLAKRREGQGDELKRVAGDAELPTVNCKTYNKETSDAMQASEYTGISGSREHGCS